MDAKQAMEIFRKAITEVKAKNIHSLTITGLERLVEYIEDRAELSGKELTSQMEHYKAQSAANLAQYSAERSQELEMFRSVILVGQNAMRSATLINGGAGVALLAFIGHLWEKDLSAPVVTGLLLSMIFFMGGVLSSAIAAGTTYLSQAFYAENWIKTGHAIRYVTIALVIVSYFAFATGGYAAYSAFLAQLKD